MARTLLIVEDDSDKYTFEALLRHINLNETIAVTTTPEIDWKSIADENNPLKPSSLIKGLKSLLNDIFNEKYDKIGIIRDMDTNNKADRLFLVNTALQAAYPNEAQNIDDVNKLVPFSFQQNGTEDSITVQFACYFVHVTDKKGLAKGEIEDILKAIKTEPSPIADCVDEHLPNCLEINDEGTFLKKLLKKLLKKHFFYQKHY